MKAVPFMDVKAVDLALHVGWLIDGTGGTVQTNRLIIIRSGCIHRIEPYQSRCGPEQEVMDLSGCTVLPPLMDAHVHLTFSGSLDPAVRKDQLDLNVKDARAAIALHLQDHWRNGVVAVRHAGDQRGDLLCFKARTEIPVDVKVTGHAWHARGRYGRMIGQSLSCNEQLDTTVLQTLNNQDHIKIINSGINSLDRFGHETQPQFTKDQMAHVCRYARQKNLPVMVHANGKAAVKASIEAGCSSIEHGYFMGRDNLGRMAERGVIWVPTAIPMAALTAGSVVSKSRAEVARRTLDHQLEQIAVGHKLGVTIALGTDAGSMGVDHGRAAKQELALLMDAGLSLNKAVRCGTLNTARLMGFKQRGAILPGWRADFLVVNGPVDRMPQSLADIVAVYKS